MARILNISTKHDRSQPGVVTLSLHGKVRGVATVVWAKTVPADAAGQPSAAALTELRVARWLALVKTNA